MIGPSVHDALVALARVTSEPTGVLLDDADVARFTNVRTLLTDVLAGLRQIVRHGGTAWLDATPLPPEARNLATSMLNQGEITIRVEDAQGLTRMSETALQGIWLVDGPDRQGIEIGDVPALVRSRSAQGVPSVVIPDEADLPPGCMNVRSVLAEIAYHQALALAGTPVAGDHEINLTLLPVTPQDHQVLEQSLGKGGIDILASGYGGCQIMGCALAKVWRVRYFNSEGKMILDMIHVGDVPVAAKATPEDMADSTTRLEELIAAYFPG